MEQKLSGLIDFLKGKIGCRYTLRSSRIVNKEETFVVTTGIVEDVTLNDEHMIVQLENDRNPERFSIEPLKDIVIVGNEVKWLYLDGSYFIIEIGEKVSE